MARVIYTVCMAGNARTNGCRSVQSGIADVSGMTNINTFLHTRPWSAALIELRECIQKELDSNSAIDLKDSAASSIDLIQAGIPAGKTLGLLL